MTEEKVDKIVKKADNGEEKVSGKTEKPDRDRSFDRREVVGREKKSEKKSSWIKMKPAELEKIIVDLAKEGKSPALIGLILRDKHGVPRTRVFGKRVMEILEEKGIDYKTEKKIVDGHVEKLREHIKKNKHDYPASRALTKKLWVVHKLSQ